MKDRVILMVVTAFLSIVATGLVILFLDSQAHVRHTIPVAKRDELVINGLPAAKIDTKGVQAKIGYDKAYQFRTEWFSRHIPIWEVALKEFKGKPDVHYLEIGLFEGRSAFWVLENILTHPTARLTGIDPFLVDYKYSPSYYKESNDYKTTFYSNLKLSGLENKTTVIEGFSQVELRKLPLKSYDIIYIDGSHETSDCMEDAILCWRLLKDGGVLIFDDYLIHEIANDNAKNAIDVFYRFFGKHFEVVHQGWQVILKKRLEEAPVTSR